MRKLLVITAIVIGVVGIALAKGGHPTPVDGAQAKMPSIHQMMSDAKDLPVQSFAAY